MKKPIQCPTCKKFLPRYEIVCECRSYTLKKTEIPPDDDSAFYWRILAQKYYLQRRNAQHNKLANDEAMTQAIYCFTKVIEREPIAQDYFDRGLLFAVTKKYNEAIEDLKMATMLKGDFTAAENLLILVESEYEFYKKECACKLYIHDMITNKKLNINELEINEDGNSVFTFIDAEGKVAIYNVTEDKLLSYDGVEYG